MSRAPAPSRRPSSSRRGWLPHQQRAFGSAAERGRSNWFPAFTQLTMLRKTTVLATSDIRSQNCQLDLLFFFVM